ncbi:MAG: hypothetical protein AAGA48_39750, partial [Myxococcota bacterium]
ENEGFYRSDATLHTIVVSDEEDSTDDEEITLFEFIRWYDGLKPQPDERTFNGVIPTEGIRYRTAVTEIGGVAFDIEAGRWDTVLTLLGLQAAGLKQEFFLSQTPLVPSIKVSIERELPTGVRAITVDGDEWTYDAMRNAIQFVDLVPDPLDTVVLDYCLRNVGPVEEDL